MLGSNFVRTRDCGKCYAMKVLMSVKNYTYAKISDRNGFGRRFGLHVFAFFIPLVGLILSILGLRDAPKFNGDRKGLATAGIVISIVSMVLNFFVIIVRVGAAL